MKLIRLLILSGLVAGCSSSGGSPGASSLPSIPNDVISVPYGIYVGLIYAGAPCSPYTNSGYFSNLNYDSEFHRVVFAAPTTSGLPGPMGAVLSADSDLQTGLVNQQVHGTGKVYSFDLCPMYETDVDAYECTVVDGPHDFAVALSVVPPQGEEGTATLKYFAFSEDVGVPILSWSTKMGTSYWGGVGGADNAFFSVDWADLMAGEEFAFDTSVPGDDGEHWDWSVRFVPETGTWDTGS